MFCCTLLYVNYSIAIILMGKRELIALLYLSSWCLVMVERLFLAVPRGSLQFVIVVFPDHTHLLFLMNSSSYALRPRPGILRKDEPRSHRVNPKYNQFNRKFHTSESSQCEELVPSSSHVRSRSAHLKLSLKNVSDLNP